MGLGTQALNADVPTGGPGHAGNQIQQRCFTGAMLSQQSHAFMALGTERKVAYHAFLAQVLCQVADFDHRFTESIGRCLKNV